MDLEAQGDLRGATRIWQSLAVTASAEEVRLEAAFRAQRARRALGVMTGEIAEFCAAERIIAGVLAQEELPVRVRADFERFAEEVAAELAERGAERRCGGSSERGSEGAFEGASEGTTSARAEMTPGPAAAAADAEAAAASARAKSSRRWMIAGAAVGAVGLGCMGVMSYGLAVDHTAADRVFALADKNKEEGLTAAEIVVLNEAITRGRAGARVALAGGLAGSALLVAGVGLLAHGGRIARMQRLALSPTLGLGGLVGVSLGGRF